MLDYIMNLLGKSNLLTPNYTPFIFDLEGFLVFRFFKWNS
jgi:hypothetical protein